MSVGLLQKKRSKFDFPTQGADSCKRPLKSAHSTGLKNAHESDRPWRLAAGRTTAAHYHCATVPDGPDCRWADGEWRRVEGRNRARNSTDTPVSVETPETVMGAVYSDWKPVSPSQPILYDLSIPAFLRRTA